MKGVISSLPLAVKLIIRDPINLFLALVPTILALSFYLATVALILMNSEFFTAILGQYITSEETLGWLNYVLMALIILFFFLLMSWTFVILVGIIAAPFNSMLSSRIEREMAGALVEENRARTLHEIAGSLGKTFVNEFKKLFAIVTIGVFALLLKFIPIFYPVGLFLLTILIAVQFVDYSWARHELSFGACLKDVSLNVFTYALTGGFFLLLVTIPLVNALVPALATGYYTVLWVERRKSVG